MDFVRILASNIINVSNETVTLKLLKYYIKDKAWTFKY